MSPTRVHYGCDTRTACPFACNTRPFKQKNGFECSLVLSPSCTLRERVSTSYHAIIVWTDANERRERPSPHFFAVKLSPWSQQQRKRTTIRALDEHQPFSSTTSLYGGAIASRHQYRDYRIHNVHGRCRARGDRVYHQPHKGTRGSKHVRLRKSVLMKMD